MKVLKIQESKSKELTDGGIVICTYVALDNSQIDAISVDYKDLYPEFEEVEVLETSSMF